MRMRAPYIVWNSFLFFVVLFLDRITKYMALKDHLSEYSMPFVSCNVIMNRGISWGWFHSNSMSQFIIITCIIAGIIVLLISQSYMRLKYNEIVWPYTLAVAGSISNFIDRIMYHGVVDFIEVSCNDWSFPIFNIADVAIVLGVGCIIVQELRK